MIKFGKYLECDHRELGAEAIQQALEDSQLKPDNIQSIHVANSGWGYYNNQHCVRGQIVANHAGLDKVPITNLENACAGGSHALHSAWKDILTGLFECSLAVGVEKLYMEDKAKQFGAFMTGIDVAHSKEIIGAWERIFGNLDIASPDEVKPKNRSVFMDFYGWIGKWHMKNFGTTQEQFAIIAAKNHCNGSLNPNAQYQFPMTVEEVMNDYMVSYPVTRSMCAPVGDGAAAAVVCSAEYLKGLPDEVKKRAVKIRACSLVSAQKAYISDASMDTKPFQTSIRAAKAAYEMAGIGPKDIDLAEVHDASAVGELMQYELLGFCGPGEGGKFAASGATQLGGSLPVNASGGLISRGHPIAASGLAMVNEIVIQVRGEAGKRQVENARIGLIENGGGMIGFEEAACVVTILEKNNK
jgi:acetyl-CoA acetyltransferase